MSPVDQLIVAFGGIRAMQRKLGEKHASVIQSWQAVGNVPHYREPQIRAAAEKHGVHLPPKLVAELFTKATKPSAEATPRGAGTFRARAA